MNNHNCRGWWLLSVILIAVLLLASCTVPPPPRVETPADPAQSVEKAEVFPTPPAPLPVREASYPEITQAELGNGLEVVVVPQHLLPTFILLLVVPGGERVAGPELTGVASLAASLLTRGTASRTAQEIASSVEVAGGQISSGADADDITVWLVGLSEYVGEAFDLLGDVVLNPAFPEQELENQRQRSLTSLQAALANPNALAGRAFNAIVYGPHPYGRNATEATLNALSWDGVVAYYGTHVSPEDAILAVIGDITPEEALTQTERIFGAWTAPQGDNLLDLPEPPSRSQQQIYLVDRPGSTQATIQMGHLVPTSVEQDRFAVEVTNQVLGAGPTSRLHRKLREEMGYTYGISSGFSTRRDQGSFVVVTSVRNEVVAPALQAILAELEALRDTPVPDQELAEAKSYLIGSYALQTETAQAVGFRILDLKLRGLPVSDLRTYPQDIAAVDQAAVQQAAGNYIHPDQMATVVVGDAGQIRESLAQVAPVLLVDDQGAILESP